MGQTPPEQEWATLNTIRPKQWPAMTAYRPTWVEWATVAGIVAYGLMAFTLGVRYLPVFGLPGQTQAAETEPMLTAPASGVA